MPEQPHQEAWSPQKRTPAPKHARRRRLFRLTLIAGIVILALVGGLTWFLVPRTPGGPFTAFPLPTDGSLDSDPKSITTGPDGNLWFTEISSDQIERITTRGTVTKFPLPSYSGEPTQITTGPDGNLWFIISLANRIGRITTSGNMKIFSIPTRLGAGAIGGITTGPDGNLWFTESEQLGGNSIGRISPAGIITKSLLLSIAPLAITAGPDGNLWFTESDANKIGRITTSGSITEFSIPTANGAPEGITVGPDGNLWFTESISSYGSGGQIERLSPPGK